MSNRPKSKRSVILASVFVILCILGYLGYKGYGYFLAPNVTDKQEYLFIPTDSSFEELMQKMDQQEILKDPASFRWLAERKELPDHLKAGKYKLEPGMNNRRLVNLLLLGLQEPVRLRFQNIRLKDQFAGLVATQLEADSASIMSLMNNDSLATSYGFTTENFFSMFIPNTYELYWNTSANKFFERMHTEYDRFWNDERLAKAKAIDLTPTEVSILASIVKGEALHTDEMPKIAGLYMNRLHRGILLQADPTVIFAAQDFTIRRVLNKDLLIDSPYNTYLYKGLPPGPIMMPSIVSIDAVLNYQKHDYLYMCAKADFSGYHSYAKTVSEHLVNARAFQRALNEQNIKR